MPFIIRPLAAAPFRRLFRLAPDELHRLGARRCVADSNAGFPCRVSLRDATPGEELLLCHFTHQPGSGPYRASGPIYVRREAEPMKLAPGDVPAMLRERLLSVRAYDETDSIVGAEVVEGSRAERAINALLGSDAVSYLHVHFAGPGCFACRVDRE